VSDPHSSSRIIAEQEQLAQQYLRQRQKAEAKHRERMEWCMAWDGVRYWLAPDGRVATQDTLAEAPPDVAVEAIARVNKFLVKRGLLDLLTDPPTGVEGEDLQAWHVAKDILHNTPDNPSKAARLLVAIRDKPFAPTVRNWLTDGFRIVVEGRWQTGPLSAEMTGYRVISTQPADEVTTESADAPESKRPIGMTRQERQEHDEPRVPRP
jgi:hypothetical protein